MSFCSSCGIKNIDSAKFCEGCGKEMMIASAALSPQSKPENIVAVNAEEIKVAENKSTDSEKGFFASAYHTLFVENNVKEIWHAWFVLIAVDMVISIILNRMGVYKTTDDPDIFFLIAVMAVFLAILIVPVRIGIVKKNCNWVLGVLILSAGIFLWNQTLDDTKSSYQLALNVLSGTGNVKSKFYLTLLMFWDQLFGSIFEIILLFRIYSILKSNKE